jgi:hypothetical protein
MDLGRHNRTASTTALTSWTRLPELALNSPGQCQAGRRRIRPAVKHLCDRIFDRTAYTSPAAAGSLPNPTITGCRTRE